MHESIKPTTSYKNWLKTLNTGHKRLWIVVSIAWFSSLISLSAYQYHTDSIHCDAQSKKNVYGETRINYFYDEEKVPYKCNYETRYMVAEQRYMITSAKYDFKYILMATLPPLVIPFIIFIIIRIGVWVHEGYGKS